MTRIKRFFHRKLMRVLPSTFEVDKRYAEWRFKRAFGRYLNLQTPHSFNEKIHWLNLYDRKPDYTSLADKLRVRDYVSARIGTEYLIELLRVYDNAEDINFEALPDKFVLRTTHSSGWNIICPCKKNLDITETLKKLRYWCSNSYYKTSREWVYRDISPRIVCEKYVETENNNLMDYKFFCFHGEPQFIQVDVNRFTYHTRLFYNPMWEKQPFGLQFPLYTGEIPVPSHLEKMLEIATVLADNAPFRRIDLYAQNEKVFFGEITFFPESGLGRFFPSAYDYVLGDLLNLSTLGL